MPPRDAVVLSHLTVFAPQHSVYLYRTQSTHRYTIVAPKAHPTLTGHSISVRKRNEYIMLKLVCMLVIRRLVLVSENMSSTWECIRMFKLP